VSRGISLRLEEATALARPGSAAPAVPRAPIIPAGLTAADGADVADRAVADGGDVATIPTPQGEAAG